MIQQFSLLDNLRIKLASRILGPRLWNWHREHEVPRYFNHLTKKG
jgi:hypothetical protein